MSCFKKSMMSIVGNPKTKLIITKREITPGLIINIVSEDFGVNPDDITSKKRSAEFVLPRQVCMYLCRHLIDISLHDIASILNKKDHTTVIHGINKIEGDIKTNSSLKERIDIITKKPYIFNNYNEKLYPYNLKL